MIRTCFLSLLLIGCTDGAKGTSVGNPTKTLMRVAPPGDGVMLDEAQLTILSMEVSNASDTRTLEGPAATDVLDGIEVELPGGDWTSIRATIEGPLAVRGTDQGATLDLQLDLQVVGVAASRVPFEVGQPHVFELAFDGWLLPENAGWTRGEDQVVRPGDVTHDVLVDLVQNRSSFRIDADGDGIPD